MDRAKILCKDLAFGEQTFEVELRFHEQEPFLSGLELNQSSSSDEPFRIQPKTHQAHLEDAGLATYERLFYSEILQSQEMQSQENNTKL